MNSLFVRFGKHAPNTQSDVIVPSALFYPLSYLVVFASCALKLCSWRQETDSSEGGCTKAPGLSDGNEEVLRPPTIEVRHTRTHLLERVPFGFGSLDGVV